MNKMALNEGMCQSKHMVEGCGGMVMKRADCV